MLLKGYKVSVMQDKFWRPNVQYKSRRVQLVKNPPAMREMQVQSLGGEDPLEEERVAHPSILVWKIPWT